MTTDDESIIPHDEPAEAAILGSIIKRPACIVEVLDLAPPVFYNSEYKRIWAAMRSLWERGQPIDYITISGHDSNINLTTLTSIDLGTPTASNIGQYATIVRNKSRLRTMVMVANTMYQRAIKENADPKAILGFVDERLEGIRAEHSGALISPERWMELFLDDITARQTGRQATVTTGLADVDAMLGGGMEKGGLYLLMAFTGTGKTELGMQVGLNVAAMHGPVLFASLEMEAEELAHRAARINDGMDRNVLIGKNLSTLQYDQIVQFANKMSNVPFWPAVPPNGYTTAELRVDAIALQSITGRVRLIVVDYLQRLNDTTGGRGANREQDVAVMAERLKSLAREMRCPVLALVQQNRDYATRRNKRPVLADIRESGRLEIEADVVLGFYRDALHNPKIVPGHALENVAEVILLKNRSGVGGKLNSAARILWQDTKYVNYYQSPVIVP